MYETGRESFTAVYTLGAMGSRLFGRGSLKLFTRQGPTQTVTEGTGKKNCITTGMIKESSTRKQV